MTKQRDCNLSIKLYIDVHGSFKHHAFMADYLQSGIELKRNNTFTGIIIMDSDSLYMTNKISTNGDAYNFRKLL